MPRCNYPTNPWLLDYIVHQKKGRSATTLHVLKCIAGPFPDGSKMMQVGDGELLMKAEFASDCFPTLDSESVEMWERSLIMIKDWEIRLILKESKEKSEYIIHINRFVVWCGEKGLSTKTAMVPCEFHPLIRENIARLWAENRPSDPPDLQDSDKMENTMNSHPLSILLEQIEKGNDKQSSEEHSSICAIPNAGAWLSVSTEDLQKKLEMKNIQDLLIHPKDAEILAAIVEWQSDYRVAENLQEKPSSSEENAVSVLPGTSTLKHQSSKISQKSSVVTPNSNEGCRPEKVASAQPVCHPKAVVTPDVIEEDTSAQQVSKQPAVVAPSNIGGETSTRQVSRKSAEVTPRSNEGRRPEEETRQPNGEAEEEIRLFILSRTSHEQIKCTPLKECDEKNKSQGNDSKNSTKTVPGSNQAVSASGTSNGYQLNKDSTETSFEIPLSGKVASNVNSNKLNSDETHASFFDSISSSKKRLPRWNNLDLSSIESEIQFDLTLEKDQRNKTQISKRIKLSQAAESTSDPPQGELSNRPTVELDKDKSVSKSSISSSLELNKSGSQENAANKVSPVNFQKQSPEFYSLISTKDANFLTDPNNLSDNLCKNTPPAELYATCQELFPKHMSCLSLLPLHNQLTAQNNLNGTLLSKESMDTINTYWSLSRDHICQRRYWKP